MGHHRRRLSDPGRRRAAHRRRSRSGGSADRFPRPPPNPNAGSDDQKAHYLRGLLATATPGCGAPDVGCWLQRLRGTLDDVPAGGIKKKLLVAACLLGFVPSSARSPPPPTRGANARARGDSRRRTRGSSSYSSALGRPAPGNESTPPPARHSSRPRRAPRGRSRCWALTGSSRDVPEVQEHVRHDGRSRFDNRRPASAPGRRWP